MLVMSHIIPLSSYEDQEPEERVEHLRKAAKSFSEHKDRVFEAKVSHPSHL